MPQTRFLGDVGKRAVAIVVQQNAVPPERDIQIRPAIIVIIPGTHALTPARQRDTGFPGYVRERSIAIVVIEMAGRFFPLWKAFERRAVDQKNVRPAIIVIVDERRAASR